MPLMTSTNFINGTGFIKCIPIKRSGRSVIAAKRVMDSDDVLVAKKADLSRIILVLRLCVYHTKKTSLRSLGLCRILTTEKWKCRGILVCWLIKSTSHRIIHPHWVLLSLRYVHGSLIKSRSVNRILTKYRTVCLWL